MKLEYGSKSQEFDASGTASATKVTLINANGAIVPIWLPADKISLSNTELFELALEALYQENFPNRAENERFSKVNQELQKNKEAADKAEQAATETKENLDTVSAITEVLIALAISQSGGMPTNAYVKVAAFVKPRVHATQMETSLPCLIRLKTMPNGQVEPRLSLSSRCKKQRAILTKSKHSLICFSKVC